MVRSTNNPWLTRFAFLTAMATLGLICIGGLVTSHNVGMSVPDWPTSYGYNMFFFPFSKWVGGIFYEHTHRLAASAVGFLTVALAVWLWLKEERRWLAWLGILALFAVILQGVLGGLRVRWMRDELGVFHATLAQVFFVLVSAIAIFSSRRWQNAAAQDLPVYDCTRLRYLYAFATAMILLQLILGATMRHQHAGLSIPDFPLAYGTFWPATDPDSITRYNQWRGEATALNAITAFQVQLQMAHRAAAVAILAMIGWAGLLTFRTLGRRSALTKLALGWVALVSSQAVLGMVTIWTNKSADVATAHVALGALSLLTGSMLVLIAARCLRPGTSLARAAASNPMGVATQQAKSPA